MMATMMIWKRKGQTCKCASKQDCPDEPGRHGGEGVVGVGESGEEGGSERFCVCLSTPLYNTSILVTKKPVSRIFFFGHFLVRLSGIERS